MLPYLVIIIICAILCAVIAEQKGRSMFGWALLGLLLGPFGLLGIALSSNYKQELMLREQLRLQSGGSMDARLEREMIDCGLKPKTPEMEKEDAKYAMYILGLMIAAGACIVLLFS